MSLLEPVAAAPIAAASSGGSSEAAAAGDPLGAEALSSCFPADCELAFAP